MIREETQRAKWKSGVLLSSHVVLMQARRAYLRATHAQDSEAGPYMLGCAWNESDDVECPYWP